MVGISVKLWFPTLEKKKKKKIWNYKKHFLSL